MSLTKRLEALEQSRKQSTGAPMRIIGTALQVTKDPALNGTYATVDNCVTFYAETKKAAFALHQQWLSKQKNTIAIIGVDNLSEHRGLHEESPAGTG